MDNAELYNLGDVAITAAVTNSVITTASDANGATQAYIDDLDGMLSATIQANFTYGSGGTTVRLMIETSLDQGTTWIEVWRALFGTASEENVINLSALTPKTSPVTPAALSDDTCLDGIFGPRWRAKITSTGTYAGNTSLAVRLNAR